MKKKLLIFLIMTGIVNLGLVIGEILNTDPRNAGLFLAMLVLKCSVDIVPLMVLKD